MYNIILTPPIAFLIILIVSILLSGLLSKLSYKNKLIEEYERKPYACGEEAPAETGQPDYSQFFPFAFFFTILHVVALVVTTVPVENLANFFIAVIYVLGAITGLFILFRK